MPRRGIIHGQWFRISFVSLFFLLLILIPSGCGDQGQSNTPDKSLETASASLKIRWHNESEQQESKRIKAAALDCEKHGVVEVVCDVYYVSGEGPVSGGPWSCSAGRGSVDGIPVGEDRTFVILAEDADGNVIFRGEKSGQTINAREVNNIGIINAYRFVTNLLSPTNGAQVDPDSFSLQWESIGNAHQYRVLVATDQEYEDVIRSLAAFDDHAVRENQCNGHPIL